MCANGARKINKDENNWFLQTLDHWAAMLAGAKKLRSAARHGIYRRGTYKPFVKSDKEEVPVNAFWMDKKQLQILIISGL